MKRIDHLDDVRAPLAIQHRPYSSVDQLTRIKGIATKRIADIKAQGLACVR
jgi:DNA uptake protein ComE-like DNA-binding protein